MARITLTNREPILTKEGYSQVRFWATNTHPMMEVTARGDNPTRIILNKSFIISVELEEGEPNDIPRPEYRTDEPYDPWSGRRE